MLPRGERIGVPPGGEASFPRLLPRSKCVFGVFRLLGLGVHLGAKRKALLKPEGRSNKQASKCETE